MKDIEYWIWLSKVKGISNLQKNKLLDYFDEAKEVFRADEKVLKQTGAFKTEQALGKFLKMKSLKSAETDLKRMDKEKISFLSCQDKSFPGKLREIYNPPVGIYLKGALELLNKEPAVAIVGSRNASLAGIRHAKEFSKAMSSMGMVIISGMAEGIDGAGHWGAIDEPGKTIGVLGSGVDICYPAVNEKIYHRIAKEGLLVSEFGLGEKPLSYHFPLRNRLISALSKGVLVIEAGKKSGSMITVNYALDQGKNVYVIPGEISNPRWAGGNELLKEGAKLVTGPEDVLEDFIVRPVKTAKNKNKFSNKKEQKIFELIIKGYDTVDELIAATGLTISELSSRLTMMEIEEIIEIRHGKIVVF